MMRSTEYTSAITSRTAGRTLLTAVALLALIACVHARAATYCITAGDAVGLQSALVAAVSNGEDDFIQLQIGQYPMQSSFLLDYEAASEHHDLTIEGGYSANFGNPCGTPPVVPDPRLTVLDGGLLRLRLAAGAGSLAVKAVTVQSTFDTDPTHPPVEIAAAANSTGNITIQNSMFLGNGSTSTAAVYILAADGALLVQNSVFAENVSFAAQSPVLLGSLQTTSSFGATIVNSTFTGNSSTATALRIYAPMCLTVAANDIFWGNTGGDVSFDNPPSTYLLNDNFGDLAEAANTQAVALRSLDPLFNPDFSLRDLSPLRDLGVAGGASFSPGAFDVIGNPRVYGSNPDIGAYEIQDVIFANGFELIFFAP